MIAAMALGISLAFAGANERAVPDTWAALQAQMPPDKAKAIVALLRFAGDDAPSFADRQRAARAARSAMAADDRRKVDALLIEAELDGALGKKGARKQGLSSARAIAKRAKLEKAARIEEAMRADDKLDVLVKAVLAFEKKKTPIDMVKIEDVKRGEAAWLAIGDERQHALARMWAARATLSLPASADAGVTSDADAVDAAAREVADALDALGAPNMVRTTAATRAELLAWRAQLLESHGRAGEGVLDRLAADRARAVDVKRAASLQTLNGYLRSRETATACKAMRAEQKSCAKLERERWGERSFYDFSREGNAGGAFDPTRADDVLAEYESLFHDCWRDGAKANLTTQTHVELEWSVKNDGTIAAHDLRPLRLRNTSVEACVNGALEKVRYPRYGGEMQHVRMSWDVGS